MRSGQGCPFPSSWFWCFLEADKGGLLTSTVSSGNFVVLGLCWWEWAATIVFQAPIWWNANVMCSTLVFFFMRSQGFFHRKFCFDWFFLIFWEAWCWWTWSWRYFGIASTWLCKRTPHTAAFAEINFSFGWDQKRFSLCYQYSFCFTLGW